MAEPATPHASPPSADRCRLGVVSDVDLAPAGSPDTHFHNAVRRSQAGTLLRRAVDRLAADGLDALLLLGDLADRPDPADYADVLDAATMAGVPVHFVPGNHDLDPDPAVADARLAAAVARHPAQSRVHPIAAGPVTLGPVDLVGFTLLRRGADCWLRAAGLPVDRPVLFVSHFPLVSQADRTARLGWPYAGDLRNRAESLDRLRALGLPVIVLSGHLHLRAHTVSGNVLQLHQAALAEVPYEIATLTISWDAAGSALTVERASRPVAPVTGPPGPVLDPPTVAFRWADGRWSRRR